MVNYHKKIYLLYLIIFLFYLNFTDCIKKRLEEQEVISYILKDYDTRVRPRGTNNSWPDTGGPVDVTVNIYLRSISKIDDVNMEYSTQFTFREQWIDERLAYEKLADENTQIPPFLILINEENEDSQRIWTPDSFFNEKEARRHLVDKPNVFMRIYPNGEILYSVRLSMVFSCLMKLHNYPVDKQVCYLDIASYAYTTDDIKYEWKDSNPIQKKAGLEKSLPSFELYDVQTDYCTSKTNTGEYSCLRTKLLLRREYSYYLIQLYIPCCMIVVVSWVSFWLDKDCVPARIFLGATTFLTMTTQASGANAKLPPVSYIKAVDIWIGVCLFFIFGALLEYALVNYYARLEILRKEKARRIPLIKNKENILVSNNDNLKLPCTQYPLENINYSKQLENQYQINLDDMTFNFINEIQNTPSLNLDLAVVSTENVFEKIFKKVKTAKITFLKSDVSKKVDLVSRIAFPFLFLLFIVIYYKIYFTQNAVNKHQEQ
ncbi:GluClalpha [Strongyloides ratti]|uniref:GluClalpha n=1 Tax=Strongyloides ratti TaxID=34506 RepID=A0A090LH44_STRRB|nr:GluClalpha [Strongyloides ratti]CEF69116.1 GluClalpha [Strongyloides ratti]